MKFLRKLFLYWVLEFVFLCIGFFIGWFVLFLFYGILSGTFSIVSFIESSNQFLEMVFPPLTNVSVWYGYYFLAYIIPSSLLFAVFYTSDRLGLLLFLGLMGLSYYYEPNLNGVFGPFLLLLPHGIALMVSGFLTFSHLQNWLNRNKERIANGRLSSAKPRRTSQTSHWPVAVDINKVNNRNYSKINKLQKKYLEEKYKLNDIQNQIDALESRSNIIDIDNVHSFRNETKEDALKRELSEISRKISSLEKQKKTSLERMESYEKEIKKLLEG